MLKNNHFKLKNSFLILSVCLLTACKTKQLEHNLEYTIINKNGLTQFKNEAEKLAKIKELQKKNIDFVVYKNYSVGATILSSVNDPDKCPHCDVYHSVYLIWKDNDTEYIRLFDNCGSYYPIKTSNNNILNYAKENMETLKNDRVKFYQTDKNSVMGVSHSSYKEFLISVGNNEFYNYFDIFNLTSESEKPNLNYLYNQNLKLIKMNSMIEAEIKYQHNLDSFRRNFTQCKEVKNQ